MRVLRRPLLFAALLAAIGCGIGDSPAEPTNSELVVIVLLASAGTYTASIDGQTPGSDPFFNVWLSSGTHEISGSFTGPDLAVSFGSFLGGGVAGGSVQSEAGPA